MPIKSQKAIKKRATLAETRVAADLGGRRTFASGSRDEKADVTTNRGLAMKDGVLIESSLFSFRAEVKTTRKVQYSFTANDWRDLVVAAEKAGQIPLFVMEIALGAVPAKFVAIRSSLYSELTGWSLTGWQCVPLADRDVNKKSFTVKRDVRTAGWGIGSTPVRRIWFQFDPPNKGDVCIISYADFLKLIKKAEETT